MILLNVFASHQLVASFLTGVASHLLLLKHGEWDLSAPALVLSCIAFTTVSALASVCSSILQDGLSSNQFMSALCTSILVPLSLLLGIFVSMGVYRLFFHRLRRFPGPVAGNLSSLYMLRLTLRRWHRFQEVRELHDQYGDFVRIAPQSRSITHPDATRAIYGSGTTCLKGPFYNISSPRETIFMTLDKAFHTRHRKDWDRAFSKTSLRQYEPQLSQHALKVVTAVERHAASNTPIDMVKWFNLFSFDLMADLAFGKSFHTLDSGEKNDYMRMIRARTRLLGLFFHTPWAMRLMRLIPSGTVKKFNTLSNSLVIERLKLGVEHKDIFSHMLETYENEPVKTPQMTDRLYGNTDLIMIAGSDTTASALASTFFLLCKHPEQAEKLYNELTTHGVIGTAENYSAQRLADLPHLNAIINETLRLYPPVVSGIQRYTPPEGLHIGDVYIPGNVNVQVPTYTAFRDPRSFPHPDAFVPERWTSQPELVVDASGYAPFTIGKYACAGKQLALMELREVMARLVGRFEVGFAEPDERERFLDGAKDYFGLAWRGLRLRFVERGG